VRLEDGIHRMEVPRSREKTQGVHTTDLKNYETVSKGQIIASKGKGTLLASEDFTPFIWGNKSYTEIFGFKLIKM